MISHLSLRIAASLFTIGAVLQPQEANCRTSLQMSILGAVANHAEHVLATAVEFARRA